MNNYNAVVGNKSSIGKFCHIQYRRYLATLILEILELSVFLKDVMKSLLSFAFITGKFIIAIRSSDNLRRSSVYLICGDCYQTIEVVIQECSYFFF